MKRQRTDAIIIDTTRILMRGTMINVITAITITQKARTPTRMIRDMGMAIHTTTITIMPRKMEMFCPGVMPMDPSRKSWPALAAGIADFPPLSPWAYGPARAPSSFSSLRWRRVFSWPASLRHL